MADAKQLQSVLNKVAYLLRRADCMSKELYGKQAYIGLNKGKLVAMDGYGALGDDTDSQRLISNGGAPTRFIDGRIQPK